MVYEKEKQKQYSKEYYQKNKEKAKQDGIEYRKNNKEKLRLRSIEYRKQNSEKIKKSKAEYLKTEKGKKVKTISSWKNRGLVEEDYDPIYERYINTHNCDCCRTSIGEGKASRCMDHNHKTGKFRNVLCHNCNILRGHLDNNYQAYLRMLTL
tara:strand:+ start:81 stop:536 length:456 start_codon:yes stop_codon:yes gene_type:complete